MTYININNEIKDEITSLSLDNIYFENCTENMKEVCFSDNCEISEIDPNFEIICHITNDCIACGIQLHKNSLN
jgi:hypothetical protein